MPVYEYLCETNGITKEVHQSIKDDKLSTWGEVLEARGECVHEDTYNTPLDAPVKRLISAPPRHVSWSQWQV